MEGGDDWLGRDKIYHVIFCFSVNLVFSLLAAQSRYPFLRRRSIWVGSIVSLAAGAAKELADELGFFKSAGARLSKTPWPIYWALWLLFLLSLCPLPLSKTNQHQARLEMV